LQAYRYLDNYYGGFRNHDLIIRLDSEELWTRDSHEFTASANEWYVVGIVTGNTISGNNTRFFIKEMSLKDEDNNELFFWNDFMFSEGTDEPYNCISTGNGGHFLTANGPDRSLYEGIWYTGNTDWKAVLYDDDFKLKEAVLEKIAEQGEIFFE